MYYAASVEQASEHPGGKCTAYCSKCTPVAVYLSAAKHFEAITGHGISATVDGTMVLLGNDKFMRQQQMNITALLGQADDLAQRGQTPIYLKVEGQAVGLIAIADPVNADSKQVIMALQQRGIDATMLTCDIEKTAHAVSAQIGIIQVEADVLPDYRCISIMVKSYGTAWSASRHGW